MIRTIHNTAISGVTITGGNDSPDGVGGAGISQQSGSLFLTNVAVTGNLQDAGHGGGIWSDGFLTLSQSVVADNAGDRGGGVYLQQFSDISNTTFWSNSSLQGGAIYAETGSNANVR